ncbi:hypothetical protein AB0D59_37440 [Streptomyces sp. NPDC048417]|uniref:hypothetical protein n=1 Tax=Streptomyces sp. NPDC048417 TaxID=3155387 RepID=UPI00341D7FC7
MGADLPRRTPGPHVIWNERHLRHALRAVPEPITDPERVTRLNLRRNDRIGGVIHEYWHAA